MTPLWTFSSAAVSSPRPDWIFDVLSVSAPTCEKSGAWSFPFIVSSPDASCPRPSPACFSPVTT